MRKTTGRIGEAPAGQAGRRLRWKPWALAAVALGLTVWRFRADGAGLLVLLGAVLLTLVVIAGWATWQDRQARAEIGANGRLFVCPTAVQRSMIEDVPQFGRPLHKARLTFLVGGWLNGRLKIGVGGVRWTPGPWTRKIFRASPLVLTWAEVEGVALVGRPGPRDPGVLSLVLVNGTSCGFLVTRRKELERVLAQLGPHRAAPLTTARTPTGMFN